MDDNLMTMITLSHPSFLYYTYMWRLRPRLWHTAQRIENCTFCSRSWILLGVKGTVDSTLLSFRSTVGCSNRERQDRGNHSWRDLEAHTTVHVQRSRLRWDCVGSRVDQNFAGTFRGVLCLFAFLYCVSVCFHVVLSIGFGDNDTDKTELYEIVSHGNYWPMRFYVMPKMEESALVFVYWGEQSFHSPLPASKNNIRFEISPNHAE